MNCPNCGSAVKEGKFCNYCGTKLPDDTKRVEVKIDKRIEDVAEVKRASYEELESAIRQKQELRKMQSASIRRKSCLVILIITLLMTIYAVLFNPVGDIAFLFAISMFIAIFMAIYIVVLLITGKW